MSKIEKLNEQNHEKEAEKETRKAAKKNRYKVTNTRTSHLLIRTMTDEEIELFIEEAKTEEEKDTIRNLVKASKDDPENKDWYLPMAMLTRKTNVRVGAIGFLGPKNNDSVKLYFIKREEYDGEAYLSEALKAITSAAFYEEGIYFVESDCGSNDTLRQNILQGQKYTYESEEDGIIHYVSIKPKTSWLSIYMCIGLSIGISLGSGIFDSTSIGVCIGMAIGAAVGAALDNKESKRRKEYIERRNTRLGESLQDEE